MHRVNAELKRTQNKPKRFKQPYFNATAAHEQTLSLLTCEEENKGEFRVQVKRPSVSAANPHLLRFSQICPRLATFWSFSLLRRNRRLAAQSQDQTYIFLICRI